MLKKLISITEKQMVESLVEIRELFSHSGNKGTSNENSFADFLRKYLPRKYEIGNGEIIDSFGNRSGQTDIIIVNEDHPFTFTPNKPGLFFIEGVSAVGEIKTILTSKELNNTLRNALKYKMLKTKFSAGSMTYGNSSDLARYYEHPPCFLFCYESQLSLENIKGKIEGFTKTNSINNLHVIDAIFILEKGSIINLGDGKGAFQISTNEGISLEGWVIHETKSVLFELFGYLSVNMPQIRRFSPILKDYIFNNDEKSE